MSDKIAGYLPRVSFLEATEPGSLTLARLYLEMATVLDHSERLAALSLFDKADHLFAAHWQTAPDAARAGMAHSLNNRAALEINAQQWADAVDAAKQAVELRRDRLGSTKPPALILAIRKARLFWPFAGSGNFKSRAKPVARRLLTLACLRVKKISMPLFCWQN